MGWCTFPLAPLRIATNLLDVPTKIIALLHEYRWTIEIFFLSGGFAPHPRNARAITNRWIKRPNYVLCQTGLGQVLNFPNLAE